MSGDPFDLARFVAAQAPLFDQIRRELARQIFGSPDDMKFHSSMTLFACATHQSEPFQIALHSFFNGKRDEVTLRSLGG